MKFVYCFFIYAIISILFVSTAMAARLNFSEIDFAHRIDTSDFLYAPLVGTTINEGVFWYREYEQEVLKPTQKGTLRSVFIRMYPVSQKNGNLGKFLVSNHLKDARQYLLPDNAVLCEPNDTLKNKMAELSLPHAYRVTRGSYPNLCSLQITYHDIAGSESERNFLSFIANNQIVTVRFDIVSNIISAGGDVNGPESIFSVSIN